MNRIINSAMIVAVLSVSIFGNIAEAKSRSFGRSGSFSFSKPSVYRSVSPATSTPKPTIVTPAFSKPISKPVVPMKKVVPIKPTSPAAANVKPNGIIPKGPTVAQQTAKNGFNLNTTKPVVGTFKPTKSAQLTPPNNYPKNMKAPPRSVKNYYYQPKYGYISQPYYHKRSDGTMWKIAAGMALGALAYSAFADDNTMDVASDLNNLGSASVSQKVYCVTQEGDQSKVLSMANLQAAKTIFDSNNVPMNCYNTQSEFAGNFR